MTYDGYGRLQSNHLPEQSAGTATVYSYNADDTPHSVADARTATTTYNYNNNRRLVTGITYTAPQGIATTPNVALAYDPAGNRTSMTDGTGSVSFGYDQLSRLTSETRYIGALSSYYHLNYGYNLANNLTSISMPDWSQQVNYGYDAAGRLSSVTATGFTNTHYEGTYPNWHQVTESVPTFASNIIYRAWGAVKQMTYGNGGQLAMSYNARLQGTRYQLNNLLDVNGAATTAGSTYDYYDDGKIRYAGRLDNNIFDRKYSYDYVGRLKEALSGSEARGGTMADGPYRQSYGYDGWGNTTAQTNRVWAGDTTTINPSFTNNRRQGWSYDANGFATASDDGTFWSNHEYDAAGKRTHFVPNIGSVGGLPAVETNDYFDGAGLPTKRVNTQRWQDPDTGSVNTDSTANFSLHSTALGGKVVAELDAQGTKTAGHVYMQGMELAKETVMFLSPPYSLISWQHTDPVTGSNLASNFTGQFNGTQELDPLGTDVTTPPDPQEPPLPPYMDTHKAVAWPIEYTGGPSDEYGITNQYLNMANTGWDAHLAEGYSSIGRPDLAQAILAHNPNVGIVATGVGVGLLAELVGHHLENGSLTLWGEDAARGLGFVPLVNEIMSQQGETAQFNYGKYGAGFNDDQLDLLNAALKTIGGKNCRDWIDTQLWAKRHVGPQTEDAQIYGLNELLSRASINMYSPSLTAEQMGIPAIDRAAIATGDDFPHKFNGVTNGNKIWLNTWAFHTAGSGWAAKRDLTGIIVHELFHVAGIDSDREGMNAQIQSHCGWGGELGD
jgi:YD repeat-containing protein